MPLAMEISCSLSSVGSDPLLSWRGREAGVHTYRALSLAPCATHTIILSLSPWPPCPATSCSWGRDWQEGSPCVSSLS